MLISWTLVVESPLHLNMVAVLSCQVLVLVDEIVLMPGQPSIYLQVFGLEVEFLHGVDGDWFKCRVVRDGLDKPLP